MNWIKKIVKRTWGFLKRYKYILSVCFVALFATWFFCLPEKLFKDPTSTVIIDKDGNLLGATIASDGQWRFPYNPDVPDKFKKAIIQFEDRSFESHWGVSLKGLARATYQNVSSGKKISGASTITMQLMRMSRKGKDRNVWQKIVEIFWATRAEWRYSKEEILALYTSNAPMGGNVVGLDAAAWRYFGRSPEALSWAETATLAVLPNAPSLMHPGKNRDALTAKRNRLLDRLYEVEDIDSITWVLSKMEELPEAPHPTPRLAPHLLARVIKDGHKGQVVKTSISASTQERVNNIVRFHHEHLKENEIHNAGVLVMEVESGNIISYVGNVPELSKDYESDVDMINAPRSTGSILKPFLYAAMLENGEITPRMLVQDIPTIMSGYSPKNYNLKYDGVVPANKAITRSLNVPLIRLLTKFGVPKFHHVLQQLKFTTIKKQPSHYGLSLILGGAEATLWDLVSAYGILARGINRYPEFGYNINKKASYHLTRPNKKLISEAPVFNAATSWFTLQAMKEVSRPEDDVNWELFSTSQQVAWKTGTSFGFRDAWAVGTNSKYVVGVWVGNADGEGRPGLIGREAAAPILFDVFSAIDQADWFSPPYDEMREVDICAESGHRASDACPNIQKEYIPKTCLSTEICHYHKHLFLDITNTYQVNSGCYEMDKANRHSWFILPAVAEYYYKNHNPNYHRPPEYMAGCGENTSTTSLAIIYPKTNSTVHIPLNFEEQLEKVVFEATHINESAKLYWHLDNTFLGETEDIHQITYQPETGKHTLTILDEKGNSDLVRFEVILSTSE